MEEKTEPPLEDDPKKHGFLILSREESTMVPTHHWTSYVCNFVLNNEKKVIYLYIFNVNK